MTTQNILLYSSKKSERLQYIGQLLGELMGITFAHTQDIEEFSNSMLPKIHYHNSADTQYVHIEAHPLLFETKISPQDISVFQEDGLPAFFGCTSNVLSFDVFAASFYLVSRYEEYLPSEKDEHGRFQASQSLAFQNAFLDRPLVNLWAAAFANALKKHFPTLVFNPTNRYRFEFTLDMDQAFAYKHKPFSNLVLSCIKNIGKGKFSQQMSVLSGAANDPYDHLDFFEDLILQHEVNTTFFMHMGGRGKYDPANAKVEHQIEVIERTLSFADIGLHPSYESNSSKKILAKELEFLQKLSSKPIQKSRQHFIKVHFPETYERILAQGISKEYSMGYPEATGFRASIGTPFYWFNLRTNKATTLLVKPFWLMDIHLSKACWTMEQALKTIAELKTLQAFNCMVYHSHLFGLTENIETQKEQLKTLMQHAS